jgi:hypothetical protein
MLRTLILDVALVVAVTVSANFATTANAAEDCGPGWWRGLAAFVIPSQPTARARSGGILGQKGNVVGRTRDLNELVLLDSISGLKATAACRTKQH